MISKYFTKTEAAMDERGLLNYKEVEERLDHKAMIKALWKVWGWLEKLHWVFQKPKQGCIVCHEVKFWGESRALNKCDEPLFKLLQRIENKLNKKGIPITRIHDGNRGVKVRLQTDDARIIEVIFAYIS